MTDELKFKLALGGVGLFAAVLVLGNVKKVAGMTGNAIAGAVVETGVGFVEGIGEGVGIPRTNAEQCRVDLANKDYWAASFSCPAGTFLGAAVGLQNTGGASGSW